MARMVRLSGLQVFTSANGAKMVRKWCEIARNDAIVYCFSINCCAVTVIFFLSVIVVFVSLCLMGNIRSVLRALYPDRDTYTESEVATARRVMAVVSDRSSRSSRLPSVYVPVGGFYEYGGFRYRCVVRPDVVPRDCCVGCAFSASGVSCPSALQCSRFDRRDGLFVWFVLEGSI